jgi:putative ABC transport system ATP-binding protein
MKSAVITTENLCKSYILGKNGVNVIKNMDLQIYKGDFTVIMGASGSGKSTLLYSISSMDAPTAGKVILLGRDITALKEDALSRIRASEISFIFQSINLLPDMTAFENIAFYGYGMMDKKQANARTEELLKKFGLSGEKNKYPSEMSGGECQRVAIARAVIGSPKVIFADEPTGALNSSASADVLDLLSELNVGGQSIVMVTHDIKACARGNRLIYLKDGRVSGDMDMGKYTAAEQSDREEAVFKFLKENKW